MSYVFAFLRFWYHFVIGDDWRIAAGVTLALGFLRRNARAIQIGGGIMLSLVGLAIATGAYEQFIIWLRPLINGFEPPI